MKIGMFTANYSRLPLERVFSDAARLGYDGIELWGGRPYAYPFDLKRLGVSEIKVISKRNKMPIIGYTPEMNTYPYNMMVGTEEVRRECLNYVRISMDVAKEMGAGFTLISAGHAGYEATKDEYWPRLIRNLRELAGYAEDIGMDLILEPLTRYESNVVVTCDDLVAALNDVGSDRLVGMCDVVPPFCNNENIMSYFTKLGSRLHHVHLVDNDGHSDTHMMPGEGRMPLRQLVHEIEASGYSGYCTIELVSAYMNEPSLGAALAIKRVRELLEGT